MTKAQLSEIFTDSWEFMKKIGFDDLKTEKQIENMMNEAIKRTEKYKDTEQHKFAVDIFTVITTHYSMGYKG